MLHSITWQTFAFILLSVIAGYYIISLLVFYHRDVLDLLKGRFSPVSTRSQPTPSENPIHIALPVQHPVLMGDIQTDLTVDQFPESVSADELLFDSADDELPETFIPLIQKALPSDNLLIGSVADLLQELKTLFKMLHEYSSSKEEGCSLVQSLLTKYPHLAESSFKDSITEYICDTSRKDLAFELQYQEVTSLWKYETAENTV